MEAIEAWVLCFCSGCILFGIAESLLPEKGTFQVIKSIIGVYILLMLLTPFTVGATKIDSIKDVSIPSVSEAMAPSDYHVQITAQTERILEKKLVQSLTNAGCPVKSLTISLDGDDRENSAVIKIQVFAGTDTEKIAQLCNQMLGFEARLEFSEA